MKLALFVIAAFIAAGCSISSENASESAAAAMEDGERTLVADIEHYDMLASQSSVGLGSWVGYPTDHATIHLELVARGRHRWIKAHFEDRSAFMRPLDTDVAELATDGSFTTKGTMVDESGPGCCPALYQRNAYDVTISGTVTADGQVTIKTNASRAHAVRSPEHSQYTPLDLFGYTSQSFASATFREAADADLR